jgi:serine/threonine protein kinase
VHSEYVIERPLGHGGFGFTYRALHRSLDVSVALKEFFPIDLVTRRADQTVEPISLDKAEEFESAKAAIFGEAQALARLKHDGIVGVFGVFEHQGTVYSVLEHIDGTSVASWLGNRKTSPDQAELDRISNKLLDALALVHDHGLLHRDIVPINILLRKRDGMPVLIDFRSAIKITPAKHITAIATGSYAPYELVVDDINAQGPWTDIYSFAAVLHRMVTGEDPPETAPRMLRDPYIPLAHRVGPGRYRPSFLKAIDWGLAASPKDRPQDVRSWRGRLLPKRDGRYWSRCRDQNLHFLSPSRHCKGCPANLRPAGLRIRKQRRVLRRRDDPRWRRFPQTYRSTDSAKRCGASDHRAQVVAAPTVVWPVAGTDNDRGPRHDRNRICLESRRSDLADTGR